MHRKIADHAPRGECAVIEGAGHLLPLEQPVALSQLLKKWAQRHHLELEDA
jgi:pimeloyl-ACP methyl ester carboxylesterase